ncbi:hypothetical protein ACSQ67_016055 [Phaseolus vulgaris]
MADAASWFCACLLVTLILLCIFSDSSSLQEDDEGKLRGNQVFSKPCDEIYVVGEGETLHTISDKCGDPFIVEKTLTSMTLMMSSLALLSRSHPHTQQKATNN